ncbi:hypothetical protein DVH24_010250 [Malus domestica]|uniref:Uncharacterized protein n=1 Tax=Malus domestica TaxID=3750 RepID=A0A498JRW5_MALDO|nr:hypothetical protein DVH24_010250 [Malus domestica]
MIDNKLLTLGLLEKFNFLTLFRPFIFGCSVFAFKWLSSSSLSGTLSLSLSLVFAASLSERLLMLYIPVVMVNSMNRSYFGNANLVFVGLTVMVRCGLPASRLCFTGKDEYGWSWVDEYSIPLICSCSYHVDDGALKYHETLDSIVKNALQEL